jgi:O-antigen/teichoic acid export membrane protein
MVSLVLGYALATADRLIVASTGDVSLLGLYGFAFSLAGLAGSLSWIIRTVIYPDVYAGAAIQGEGPALREHLTKTVLPFSWILSVLLGFGAVLLGPFVAILVPEYLGAIPAARLLLFMGVTAGFEGLGVLGIVAAGRQRYLPIFSAGALILNVVLSITALRSGFGLVGVAGAALISNLGFGLAALGLVCRLSQMERPGRFLLRVVFPVLWCTVGSSAIGQLRPGLGIAYSCISAGLFLLVILPLLPGVWSEVGKVRNGEG